MAYFIAQENLFCLKYPQSVNYGPKHGVSTETNYTTGTVGTHGVSASKMILIYWQLFLISSMLSAN